ncbi:hypothetical protein TB2_031606 [Malus domestica]
MIAFSKIDEASFSESIEEALAFSKAGLLRDLTHIRENTPNKIACSKIEEAPSSESREPDSQHDYFLKIEERTSKHAQPLLTFETTLPTRLLAPKSKRHRPPNLESQTPNMITSSKIEETLLSESRESYPQHDCFLKNRRGIVLRISRARYHRPLFQSALTELKHVKLAAPTTVL